jgi:hypothetical protein
MVCIAHAGVRIKKMRALLFLYLSFSLILIGCSSNGSVNIDLPAGVHLEDTTAGSFLKALRIKYKDDLSFIGEIRESLNKYAVLEDEYLEGKNETVVKRWRIRSVKNKRSFILYEKIATNNIWFDYPLEANGIHYADLIGEKSKDLKPNRTYEGAVYIRSKTDYARLVLFGFGDYCKYMAIMGGA